MGEKRVSLRHEGEMRFVARTGSEHEIAMDNAVGSTAPRPTEVLLAALAGCTAMDVVSILRKKRQVWDSYGVDVLGVQREGEHPDVFTSITVVHVVTGAAVEVEAVRRAIELSATKYCTVSAQLASGVVRISHRYAVRRPSAGDGGAPVEETGEVIVTGPARDVLGNAPGPETVSAGS